MDNYKDFFIGAYATSPTLNSWDEDKEIEYYQEIKKNLNIKGLELPFWGELHKHNEELFLSLLDENWDYVLTTLPGTMKSLATNPHFGIASVDELGRKEAVGFLKNASLAIKKINDFFGEKKVLNIVVATAPSLKSSQVSSSVKSLIKSLEELITFDWQGASLVIEHCDSGRESFPVKGFLSLDEEVDAVQYINKKYIQSIGIAINWARSVLEKRNVDTPVKHIELLGQLGLLKGLMFSGTSSDSIDYGNWTDLHLPIAREDEISYYEKDSLMTAKEIKKTLLGCNLDTLDYIGVKVLSMPIDQSSMKRRIGLNADTLKILNQTIKEIK